MEVVIGFCLNPLTFVYSYATNGPEAEQLDSSCTRIDHVSNMFLMTSPDILTRASMIDEDENSTSRMDVT